MKLFNIIIIFTITPLNFIFAVNTVLIDAEKCAENIRDKDGWLDPDKEDDFFKIQIFNHINFFKEKLNVLIKAPADDNENIEKLQQLIVKILDKAEAENKHNLTINIFYNELLIRLFDFLNKELKLISEHEFAVWNPDIIKFMLFAQNASPLDLTRHAEEVNSFFHLNRSPTVIIDEYKIFKTKKIINFHDASWFLESCRRLLDSNFFIVHTSEILDEQDINFAFSRQIGPIGVVTQRIEFDGRSRGPAGFAEHDFQCHIKLLFKNKVKLSDKHFMIYITTHKDIKIQDLFPMNNPLPVRPWEPLKHFYNDIIKTGNLDKRKKLNLGFFVSYHENYKLFQSISHLTKYNDDNKQRWLENHNLKELLPADLENIDAYLSEMINEYCEFRDTWFSKMIISKEDQNIFSLQKMLENPY